MMTATSAAACEQTGVGESESLRGNTSFQYCTFKHVVSGLRL